MGEMNWELEKMPERDVTHGDVRIVNMSVKVIFIWSDSIVTDWDEDSKPLETTSGYIMKVLDNQTKVYSGEESVFIANAYIQDIDI